jgi:hypothetical protein
MGGVTLNFQDGRRMQWPPVADMTKPSQVGESVDDLCRRLTGYPSVVALFEEVNADYVPSIYLRDRDHERLADAYDAEAQRRNDSRRAARFAMP